MTQYDVFNGDADGICALLQLRLAEPRPEAVLVTGVKRDINLLSRVQAKAGDQLTVLDISMDKNRQGLNDALANGASVFYADHHFAGDIPDHPNLDAHISTNADVCTAMIVNGQLYEKFQNWAITAAFGDNLNVSAEAMAKQAGLDGRQTEALKELGILINYNGYGADLSDLHFRPGELFKILLNYEDPLDFCKQDNPYYQRLANGYEADVSSANELSAYFESEHVRVFVLPNAAWSRRVSGVFSNQLANLRPSQAHAVITEKADGNYLVSIRAPLIKKSGADEFCRQYATGGGRMAAAGINDLPHDELESMIGHFDSFYRNRLSA
jgi:hypothetical protein